MIGSMLRMRSCNNLSSGRGTLMGIVVIVSFAFKDQGQRSEVRKAISNTNSANPKSGTAQPTLTGVVRAGIKKT
jgi:hypothetical protein